MYFLLLLMVETLGVEGAAAPAVIYAAAPAERGAYHVGGKGVYNYGYNTGDGIAKVEVRHPDGSVTGSYRYFDPLGRQIVRTYIADKKGFRILGNELPVAPDTPAIGILDAQTLTGPVEGTQEFSSPNIVTQDDSTLLLQNSGDARSAVVSASLYEDAISKNNDVLAKQRDLIRKQEENLEQLKSQQREFLQQQKQQIDQLKLLQRQEQQINSASQLQSKYVSLNSELDSPYFYSADNIRYDFPAGFAYTSAPVRIIPAPIGVTGEHQKLVIPAGHTSSRKALNPVYSSFNNRINFYRSDYRQPYIIGHSK